MVDFIRKMVSLLNEMVMAPPPASGGGRGGFYVAGMQLICIYSELIEHIGGDN